MEVEAPGEVDHRASQRLVHRHVGVAVAGDVGLVAQRFGKGLPQRDGDVFDRVVVVHVQIAVARHLQVEAAVLGEEVEHVVEEADAGVVLVGPRPVQRQADGDVGLAGRAADLGGARLEVGGGHAGGD